MLNDAEIKSRDWHDPLNETYGWMFGGWGFFECQSGWRFIIEDMLRGLDAKLTGDEREVLPHLSGQREIRDALSLSQWSVEHRTHRRRRRGCFGADVRRLRRPREAAGQGLDLDPVRPTRRLEGLT